MATRMKAESFPMDLDAFTLGLRDATDGVESRLTEEEFAAVELNIP